MNQSKGGAESGLPLDVSTGASAPPTVYTGGTFDIFHVGHVRLFKQCKKLGRVVVALNTDEFIERYKGEHPIVPFWARKETLLSCKYVDEVITNESGEDSKPTILEVEPDFIVIGSDWKERDYFSQMNFTQEWLNEHGIQLIYVPYTVGISSSQLRKYICD